jgi:hypothetical protein
MDQRDLMRQAGTILDRAAQNLVRILVGTGTRVSPATADRIRGVLSSAIAEGIALGERYAQWRRGHVNNPFPETERDEDLIDTRPMRLTNRPPKP